MTSLLAAKRPSLLVTIVVLTWAAAACGSSATTSVSPSPVAKCQVTVTGGQLTIDATGGTGALTVSAPAECGWTASAVANWISGLTPASGQGNGEIKFQVAPNPDGAPRQADISLNDATAKVTQSGASCGIGITPNRQTVPVGGGTGSVTVTAPSGCVWAVTSSASWLTATAGGTGAGTVDFSVTANGGAPRTATLTIGTQTFIVTQPAVGGQCTYVIQPDAVSIEAAGGQTTVAVQSDSSCSWTAASSAPWVIVDGAATRNGSGSIMIRVSANAGAARTATVTFADQTLVVTQAGGCTSTIDPVSQTLPAVGGNATPVAVTTQSGCQWTATTTASWVTITSSTSGNGNGTVAFSVAPNAGAARNATISIAGRSHIVNQVGCAVSIDPSNSSIPGSGGDGAPIAVAAESSCQWTATSQTTWITITSGTQGTGNGSVAYTVDANAGAARTGTIRIATNTFTVAQAAACAYSISPTEQTFDEKPATSEPVSVTAAAGCSWTATSNNEWINVKSGEAGTGNGTVTFTVSRNNGDDTRVGTLTIAGRTFTVTQTRQ